MNRFPFGWVPLALCAVIPFSRISAATPTPSGPQTDGDFRKVILDSDRPVNGKVVDSLKDPMELAVAPDGRVLFVERDGVVKLWSPKSDTTTVIATLPVFTTGGQNLEDGLLGIALDPGFQTNHWVYLNRSLPETGRDSDDKKTGIIRVSRFTLNGNELDLKSEQAILDIPTQREQCCHVGGSLAFDARGNLFVSVGDNTNPFDSDGFAPIDERPGRSPWDAQKSSSSPNDLRGGISRIRPLPEGGHAIPEGNLFPPGTPGTRPEIYVMGCRNPFRISVDQRTGYVYWGDVGPDAGEPKPGRGPAGYDEINQARQAGFFGWPYFMGDNRPYAKFDFETRKEGANFDARKPVNNSPNNTGAHELPPAMGAFIHYAHFPSTRFPVVNSGGGRTAMAGPVYYFDPDLKSEHKLPARFNHTLFIYEWSRNWIIAVHLDEKENLAKMERFCPNMTFKRPMDLELGSDGCLYLIEYGTAWANNLDSQIVRIEYTGGHL